MQHSTEILLGLLIVYIAAQVGAEIAQRLQLPAVVGEIAAGCVVGPSALGWVTINEPLEVLAEIGAVLLLFSVGLETRIDDLRRVGRAATYVGVAGVVLPFVLGAAWAKLAGFPTPKAMFIAAAFVATIYGIGMANLFFLPMASKLKVAIQSMSEAREMVIEGMISIAQGENPRSIESKLQGYLH